MNTMLRSSGAPHQTALAPSPLTTTARHGAGAAVPRGVWIGGGLMALTIVALATALVVKSGSGAESTAPQVGATMPAPISTQANVPATTTPPVVATAQPAPIVAQAPIVEPAPTPAPVHRAVRHTAPTRSTTTTTTTSTPDSSGNTTVASTGTSPAPTATTSLPPVQAAPVCTTCGVVDSYKAVEVAGQPNGVGAVAGGVGGAVLGSQIIRHNRTLGGVIGAIGGGLLGNEIEKHQRTTTMYDVEVRMADGSMRTVRQATVPQVGAHVSVEGNALHAAPQGTSGQSLPQGSSSYQNAQGGNGGSGFSPSGS